MHAEVVENRLASAAQSVGGSSAGGIGSVGSPLPSLKHRSLKHGDSSELDSRSQATGPQGGTMESGASATANPLYMAHVKANDGKVAVLSRIGAGRRKLDSWHSPDAYAFAVIMPVNICRTL